MTYGKPSMTNLPPEIGVKIFKQILSSPVPDDEKLRAESQRLVQEIVKARSKKIADENAVGII